MGCSWSPTAQKMKFPIKGLFSKCDQIRRKLRIWSADLVTFTEEILNEKLHFLCSVHPDLLFKLSRKLLNQMLKLCHSTSLLTLNINISLLLLFSTLSKYLQTSLMVFFENN